MNKIINGEKTVLITGCTSGFGYYTALKFARNGYKTFASVRSLSSSGVKSLEKIAKKETLPLEIIHIDVTDNKSVEKGIKLIEEKNGKIDVLVNNAGFGYLGPLEEFSVEEIKEQYETNIFGMLRLVKLVVPIMRENKSGTIINVSSINGIISFPLWSAYSSSKFALESLTESLRFEVAPFGIKVSLIEPGSFLTNFSENVKYAMALKKEKSAYLELTEHFFSRYFGAGKLLKNSPLGKLFNGNRVSNAIFNITQQSNPKLRNIIGIDAHIYMIFRNYLPFSVWNWILRRIYNW